MLDRWTLNLSKEYNNTIDAVGIVLCGGNGSRLHEVTQGRIPKHLLPLTPNVTILDAVVYSLRKSGIEHVILVTTDRTTALIDKHRTTLPDLYEGSVCIENEHHDKRGAASVMKAILPHIPPNMPIVKMLGDVLQPGLDLKKMIEAHTLNNARYTAAVSLRGTEKYKAIIDRDTNQILQVHKINNGTDVPGFTLTGTWIIGPEGLSDYIDSLDRTSFLHRSIETHSLYGYIFSGPSININTPEDYLLTQSVVSEFSI